MKLKGLVWFFAITLIVISLYQLSFTWVVNSHESSMKQKAIQFVSRSHPGISGDEKDALVDKTFRHYLDSTRDQKIYPLLGTTYQKSKENELSLGLDLQGGMAVTLDVSLDGLLKSLSNNPKDPAFLKALETADNEKKDCHSNRQNQQHDGKPFFLLKVSHRWRDKFLSAVGEVGDFNSRIYHLSELIFSRRAGTTITIFAELWNR